MEFYLIAEIASFKAFSKWNTTILDWWHILKLKYFVVWTNWFINEKVFFVDSELNKVIVVTNFPKTLK